MERARAALLLFALGCQPRNYLLKQAAGQLRLLRARQRISVVLSDPRTPDDLRRRLALAKEARDFGVTRLGLIGGDAFTRFLNTGDQPIAWNVSAAPKDELRPHVWVFPITGAVPYLGFFREPDARREEARLRAAGYDTQLREVAGYSTLGFFSDPVYSSMLQGSDARIVEVVLHEMLHGTIFLPGHADWNESLATFVGLHGAALFFRERGEDAAAEKLFKDAAARTTSQEKFHDFIQPVLDELRALYASQRPREEKLKLREEIFTRAQATYREKFPPRPGRPLPLFLAAPLNNAVLLGYSTYHKDTPEHLRLYTRLFYDLPAFIRLYKHAVQSWDDPIAYLKSR